MIQHLDIPSIEELSIEMVRSECRIRHGWCDTHERSVLIHDGGRIACGQAWEALNGPRR